MCATSRVDAELLCKEFAERVAAARGRQDARLNALQHGGGRRVSGRSKRRSARSLPHSCRACCCTAPQPAPARAEMRDCEARSRVCDRLALKASRVGDRCMIKAVRMRRGARARPTPRAVGPPRDLELGADRRVRPGSRSHSEASTIGKKCDLETTRTSRNLHYLARPKRKSTSIRQRPPARNLRCAPFSSGESCSPWRPRP